MRLVAYSKHIHNFDCSLFASSHGIVSGSVRVGRARILLSIVRQDISVPLAAEAEPEISIHINIVQFGT